MVTKNSLPTCLWLGRLKILQRGNRIYFVHTCVYQCGQLSKFVQYLWSKIQNCICQHLYLISCNRVVTLNVAYFIHLGNHCCQQLGLGFVIFDWYICKVFRQLYVVMRLQTLVRVWYVFLFMTFWFSIKF